MSETKSPESEESRNRESLNDFDPRDAVRRNKFKLPRKGHNRHVPKPHDKKIVYSYAAYGATNEDIACLLGMDDKTLAKYYSQELTTGRATAHNVIAQRIYQLAIGKEEIRNQETGAIIQEAVKPNLTALIFLAKVRLGWRETSVIETRQTSQINVYLPDNGMKCELIEAEVIPNDSKRI